MQFYRENEENYNKINMDRLKKRLNKRDMQENRCVIYNVPQNFIF